MTDNSPARRAALARQAEQARYLNRTHNPSGADFSPEAFERHAEAVAPRGVAGPLGGYQYGPLRTGHAPAQDREERKREQLAKSFQYDEQMEVLLGWEAKGDPRLDKIDPSQRLSLGFYRRGKDAARKLGLPTGKPEDDGNGW